MSEQIYRHFINPFQVIIPRSYKKGLSIGEDHSSRLLIHNADPEIAAMILTYDPVWQAFRTATQNLSSARGTYKGKTQSVEESFFLLSHEKLPYWEGQIHSVYPKGKPEETALFPEQRKVFQHGTYEMRIDAIEVLGNKCAADGNPILAAVSVNILAFHTLIESARVLQQSEGEGAVANLRTLRETAGKMLAIELFGNMCLLLHKHRDNPTEVSKYFEMKYLQSSGSNLEEVEVDANDVVNINDDIQPGEVTGKKAKNTSKEDVTLGMYFADSLSERPQPNTQVLQLRQGVQVTLDETVLGPPKPFLNVINMDTDHLGTMEITGDLVQGGHALSN